MILVTAVPAGCNTTTDEMNVTNDPNPLDQTRNTTMDLGAFSVSLAVKDLATSRTFYETLGFSKLAGSMEQNYLIMKNETTLIGLFQGMFEDNILTFNPGWDSNGKNYDPFTDVRVLQDKLKAGGITPATEADPNSEGPASMVIVDPDGNAILIDQHR